MFTLMLLIATLATATEIYASYIGPVHYHTLPYTHKHIDPSEVLEKHPYTFCPPEYKPVSPYEIKQECNYAGSSITCWHHYAWCKQIRY